jgi:hypothetical protein
MRTLDRKTGDDLAKPYLGWCFWCGKAYRQGFAEHLRENRSCMILARAMAAKQDLELQHAADLLQVHADRLCSEEFAQQHQLVCV